MSGWHGRLLPRARSTRAAIGTGRRRAARRLRRGDHLLEVVARFLGLLELYRDGAVAFDQAAALAELRVRWIGPEADDDQPVGDSDGDQRVDEEYE